MTSKTVEEKKATIRASRSKNYRASLRLEGFSNTTVVHGSTKAEVIAHFKKAAQK